MSKFRFTFKVMALAIFMFASVSIAQAQASRTWVSGVGDDVNPCSRTAPCKTWAGAISKTAACGEIDALDPGGFGAVTITKSITLDGTGTMASILASLVTGITINAQSTDVITIRGISINGFCNGLRGINILQAKAVNVEDCVIFRFAGPGILSSDNNGLKLNIRNTVIRDNTGDGLDLTAASASPFRMSVLTAITMVLTRNPASRSVRLTRHSREIPQRAFSLITQLAAHLLSSVFKGARSLAMPRVSRRAVARALGRQWLRSAKT